MLLFKVLNNKDLFVDKQKLGAQENVGALFQKMVTKDFIFKASASTVSKIQPLLQESQNGFLYLESQFVFPRPKMDFCILMEEKKAPYKHTHKGFSSFLSHWSRVKLM